MRATVGADGLSRVTDGGTARLRRAARTTVHVVARNLGYGSCEGERTITSRCSTPLNRSLTRVLAFPRASLRLDAHLGRSHGKNALGGRTEHMADLLKPNETIARVRRRTANRPPSFRASATPLRPHLPCSPAPLAHVRPPRPRRPSASSTERTSSDGWVVRVASRSDGRRISVARSAKRNGQEATGERITLEARHAAR